MAGPGERSHRDGLRCVPALDPRGQHKRQPMGGDRRMEKRDAETCERNRGENGLVHEHEKRLSRLRIGNCTTGAESREFIGLTVFEPATFRTRGERSTKLSHSPNCASREKFKRRTPYLAHFAGSSKP